MITDAKNDDIATSPAEIVIIAKWCRNRSFYHIIKNVIKCKIMSKATYDKGIAFFSPKGK